MINIINTTNSVILLQDFAPTKTPVSKYAIKADNIAAQKVLDHIYQKTEEIITLQRNEVLEPNNIRIIGHYETLEEAKFILRKLRKSVKHDETSKARSSDAVVIIDTTSYNKSEHEFTPKYTNGVSNVTHHIEELNGNRNNSMIRLLHRDSYQELESSSSLTFRDWALQNETK